MKAKPLSYADLGFPNIHASLGRSDVFMPPSPESLLSAHPTEAWQAGLFAQSLCLEKSQAQSNFWHCSLQSAVQFLT